MNNPSNPDTEIETLMVRMATTCVDAASKSYGVTLDYSLDSLDGLERVLKEMHEEHLATPISSQGIHVRCLSLGSLRGRSDP